MEAVLKKIWFWTTGRVSGVGFGAFMGSGAWGSAQVQGTPCKRRGCCFVVAFLGLGFQACGYEVVLLRVWEFGFRGCGFWLGVSGLWFSGWSFRVVGFELVVFGLLFQAFGFSVGVSWLCFLGWGFRVGFMGLCSRCEDMSFCVQGSVFSLAPGMGLPNVPSTPKDALDSGQPHHMRHHHMPFGFIDLIFCRSLAVDEENIDPRMLEPFEPLIQKTPGFLNRRGILPTYTIHRS